jgi:hypothetical protein
MVEKRWLFTMNNVGGTIGKKKDQNLFLHKIGLTIYY